MRDVFIERSTSERLIFSNALDRYLAEITPSKKTSTQRGERFRAAPLREFFGAYAMAAISVDLVARCRDQRLSTKNPRHGEARVNPLGGLKKSIVSIETGAGQFTRGQDCSNVSTSRVVGAGQ